MSYNGNVFFVSDTHFRHKKIIEYSNRPFDNVEEMDETMISNWNKEVTPKDTIFHLGDFGFSSVSDLNQILSRLNGHKIFIMGNHDKQMRDPIIKRHFVEMTMYKEIRIEPKQPIILFHFPIASWDKSFHGSWHVHGHSHGNYIGAGKIHDAGVDVNNYTPLHYDDLKKIMDSKPRIGEKQYAPI